MKARIKSNDRMSNAGLHRSGGKGSPFSRWSLQNLATGNYINLYDITKSNEAIRGDCTLDIEADLEAGRYLLATGRGRDRIEQEICVGDAAESLQDRIDDVMGRLPRLDGSKRQVKWAEDIRRQWVREHIDDQAEIDAVLQLTDAGTVIDYRDRYPSEAI